MGRINAGIGAHELLPENVGEYIKAGRAVVTVQNSETGNHFTYSINRKGVDSEKPDDLWFVSVLTGNDYVYLGLIKGNKFFHTKGSTISSIAPSFQVFSIVMNRYVAFLNPHKSIKIMHNGYCGRCGRELTNPESIETGLGPVCGGRV